jgi:hypothetical protein
MTKFDRLVAKSTARGKERVDVIGICEREGL